MVLKKIKKIIIHKNQKKKKKMNPDEIVDEWLKNNEHHKRHRDLIVSKLYRINEKGQKQWIKEYLKRRIQNNEKKEMLMIPDDLVYRILCNLKKKD